MDIKQIPGQVSQQQIDSGKSSKTPDTQQGSQSLQNQSVAVPSEDKVELSGLADKLKATIASLDTVTEVNADKVASLKSAIESGSYQVNLNSTADKLVSFELSFPE